MARHQPSSERSVRWPSKAVEFLQGLPDGLGRPSYRPVGPSVERLPRMCLTIVYLLLALLAEPHVQAQENLPPTVEFARDIRPILSENCFQCHGPDEAQREADLRLDRREGLYGEGSDAAIITPGRPEESELFRRISSTDAEERMPPPDSGIRLTDEQITAVKTWIEQGAAWQTHWSFVTPKRPQPPSQGDHLHVDPKWPRNGIDSFVLSRLTERKLSPSPEASKETLIRRVSFDLTGLPPTPDEVDRFLADDRPDAYQRLVDRLLASPRYGERMSAVWLDAARYADSYGYQDDGEVSMWRWRDWVIEAFNNNMPFDQFTIEQLAGDLLPNATFEQRIATGFNRNHRANSEGGAIPEEFRVEYVADRVDTTATVWLGMTVACARCHDHKFDPVSQREFYQLFAFFNNVAEDGRARKNGNTPPLMPAPTRAQQRAQRQLESDLQAARDALEQLEPQIMQAQVQWERSMTGDLPDEYTVTRDLERRIRFDDEDELSEHSGSEKLVVSGGDPEFCDGKLGRALVFDGRRYVDTDKDAGHFSDDDKFSLSVWVRPKRKDGGILSHLELADDPRSKGYNLLLSDGRLRFTLVQQWFDDAIRIETDSRLALDRWSHVLVTYDASRLARGIHIYVDGVEQPLDVELDSLFQGFGADKPVRVGMSGDPSARFYGAIDDVRIYEDELSPAEAELLVTLDKIDELLHLPSEKRTASQQNKLRAYFLERHAPSKMAQANEQVRSLEGELHALVERFPTVMVMEECAERRPTHLLIRGRYDAPGDEVIPDVPNFLPKLPADTPRNRLGFARWLVQPDHPLTARVTVNRLWQMSFGTGLVKTAEDFGSQGEPPSHPRLLDWLATELIRTGWDLKAVRRLIVTSGTYRQSSRAAPETWTEDPENRWLSHGPRFRLPAEMIRDQALFASGLLVEQLGGESVRPYQPAKLWSEISDDEYEQDHGPNLYRRSLYTFWKRTIPHPAMKALDAVDREICAVREGRTNTPLQALTLMNEEGFVESARVLAERVLADTKLDTSQKLVRAFRLATGRQPRDAELALLEKSLRRHREHYAGRPKDAEKLVATGEKTRNEQFDVVELAAFTTMANTLLNLDETVTQH